MKALCYCKTDFEDFCKARGWNDTNVPEDWAFISICSTPDVARNIIQDEDEHYFKEPHQNVLNVEFDDITSNEEQEDANTIAYGLSTEDSFKIVKFIRLHVSLGKNFLVHCRAGRSRSQAIVRYMLTTYGTLEVSKYNPPTSWNSYVLDHLRTAAHLLFEDVRGTFIANNIAFQKFEPSEISGLVKVEVSGETYIYAEGEGAWIVVKTGEILDDFSFWKKLTSSETPPSENPSKP